MRIDRRRQRLVSFRLLLRGCLGTLVMMYLYLNLVVHVPVHELSHVSSESNDLWGVRLGSNHNLPSSSSIRDYTGTARRQLKLQEKLDDIFKKTGRPYEGDLWELSDYAPPWMKEYFHWHREERKKLTPESFDEDDEEHYDKGPKLLVMQCLKGLDDKCGGTADRLKPFLFLLREAYESRRLLLIHWTLPAPLEEFLLPPQHGIDWRAPPWLSELLHDKSVLPGRKIFKLRGMKAARNDQSSRLIRTRLQSATGGAEYYNEEIFGNSTNANMVTLTGSDRSIAEHSFEQVYHDAWRIFFTPSPTVRANVESYMEKWNLVPGHYAAAHLRALYGRISERPESQTREWTQNALNCASKLRPGGPFLFASDHSFAIQAALDYGKEQQTKVVARPHESEPLHLDNADNIENRLPHEFYDVFIDLYLMGMSRCLTYNRGGFGQWALLIGYDSTCAHNQKTTKDGIKAPCDWTESTVFAKEPKRSRTPLFLSSVLERATESTARRQLTSFSSQELPEWMTEYFNWHQSTLANLTETNYRETKYLVMVCDRNMHSCGGISDRLKPLPFVVLQAARHRRLLFIDWQKPKPLQEFLTPPTGGLDWRVPKWFRPYLKKLGGDTSYGCDDCNRKLYIKANDPVVRLKIQTSDAGESLYESLPDSHSTYAEVFHGLFRAMFQPVARLQRVIDDKMHDHDLVPGQYSAVHLRNLYGNRQWRDPDETIRLAVNGINCASSIFPGAPVYYASDDKFALEAARAYAAQRNLTLGSLDGQEQNPIHLDKDDGWESRKSSEYDDTFVDLYLLGEAKCVAYSNGGYGSFGSLLSYEPGCNVRYFKGRKTPVKCDWTDADGSIRKLAPPVMEVPAELYVKPN